MNTLSIIGWKKRCTRGVWVAALSVLVAQAVMAQDDTSLPAVPDYYQEPGLSRNKNYESQAVNEAIDTFSGKLQYHFTDLFIPGNGGLDIAVQRSYNAIDDPLATTVPWPQEFSPAGLGWTMHFGRIIRGANLLICSSNWSTSTKNPVLEMPDGQRRVLYEYDMNSPTMWVTKDFWRASCNTDSGPPSGFNVYSPDGTRYEMTTPGHSFGEENSRLQTYYTTRIVDRNGNVLNLNYTQVNGVWAVSNISHASDGRSVTFSYDDSGLAAITDGTRTWEYTMQMIDGRNYLTEVTRPDSLSWKFAYRTSSPGTGSMNRVEYPSGGTVDYTYDHVYFRVGGPNPNPSTVIKTKVSTPGGGSSDPAATWTYNYAPATTNLPYRDNGDGTLTYWHTVPPVGTAPIGGDFSPSQLDITTIEGPEAGRTVTHYHIGARSVNFAGAAGRAIGRYLGSVSPLEVVNYGYHDIRISGQSDVTGGQHGTAESATYAGVRNSELRERGPAPGGGFYETFGVERSGFDVWGNPALLTERGFGGSAEDPAKRIHTRTRALTYDINTSRWLIRQVSSEVVTQGGQSHTTNRTFDANTGNVMSETVAGVPTTFTYHPTGDVQTRTNALNQTTTYSNYKRGIAQSESQPGDVTLVRVVDDAGNVTSTTNGRGFTTTYSYDGLNRVTGVNPPVGNAVTVDYTALSKSVTRGGMVNQQTFDGLGRLVRQEASAPGEISISVDYRYDARGRRVFQSNPNSSLGLTFSYDDLDRVVETAFPPYNGQSYSTFNSYIGMSNTVRDSTGRFTTHLYRSFGDPSEQQVMEIRQGRSTDGISFTSTYRAVMERNVLGQITSLVKGRSFGVGSTDGWTRSYGYNANFHLTSQTDPEVGTTIYGRDLLGNMTSKQVGSQPVISYEPDARNRVRTITYAASENPLVPQAPNVTYTYLNTDVVESVTSGAVVRSYVYDGADKVTSETLVADAGRSYTVGYGYNGNEAMSTLTYPSGSVVSFNPDGFGRPAAAAPYVTDVDYHFNGMPQQISYANGVTTEMGLNERLWPASLNVNRTGGNIVQNTYGYDLVGNLTSISDGLDSSYDRAYGFDFVNRLTSEEGAGGTFRYRYDIVGNIIAADEGLWFNGVLGWYEYKTYAYDGSSASPTGSGRLLSYSDPWITKSFQYDLSGNARDNGVMSFGYDRANNMRCSNCGDAAQTLHHYDGTNVRVKSIEGGAATYSLYDHRGLLLQTETPGVVRKEYVYLGRRQVAERRVSLN